MFYKLLFGIVLAISASAYGYDCPAEGQHFYRYPYDCAKFIECNNGVAKLADCISGLYFDVRSSFCDFPDNVECVVEEMPVNTPKCPEINGEFATFLAHANDCTKYYECDWGVPIMMDCPKDLYFNTNLNVCDYPEDSGCVQKI